MFGRKRVEIPITNAPTTHDDTELIAAIIAAIAASLNTPAYNLKIKSLRRVYDTTPAWSRAGRTDMVNSRI